VVSKARRFPNYHEALDGLIAEPLIYIFERHGTKGFILYCSLRKTT